MDVGETGHKMAEAVYITTSLHKWYYQELRKFLSSGQFVNMSLRRHRTFSGKCLSIYITL